MSFPNPESAIDLLGHKAKDKITGMEGVIVSVAFDLYGCVQVVLHPGLDKDGKLMEQLWFDVGRLELTSPIRVMEPPPIGPKPALVFNKGPAEKPIPSRS